MRVVDVSAIFVSVILLFSVVALTGCLDDEVSLDPEIDMTVQDAEIKEYDARNRAPKDDHVFLYIQVRMENLDVGSDFYPVARHFELETDKRYSRSYHDEIGFPSKIAGGESDTFRISFEIQEDETGMILRYRPDWSQEDPLEADVPPHLL